VHDEEPTADENVAWGQLEQADALVVDEYWPAKQLTHAPAVRYLPTAHVVTAVVQTVAPNTEVSPDPHAVQLKEPTVDP